MRSLFRSRTTAVVAGAAVVVSLGATSAVAGSLISSSDIRDGSIQSHDIGSYQVKKQNLGSQSVDSRRLVDESITLHDVHPHLVNYLKGAQGIQGEPGDQGAKGEQGPAGPAGKDFTLEHAALAAPKTIEHIGGTINTRATYLDTSVELPAGKYLVQVDGAFSSASDAADKTVDVYPQLSLWLDRNDDGQFRWQEEGDISPNAVMPVAKNRHISVNGTTVVDLDEDTTVGLLGFGYTSTQGSERSGEINVVRAMLTATKIG
ncbi:MAG: collagen-like triple helix repeat-containing protein [Nocardioidaceae bacterium]